MRWRLLDLGPLPAWRQMALDAVLVQARDAGEAPDTLRFMEFEPHAVLVGYHQVVDWEVDRARCQALGVEINRRITGGGTVYLDRRQLGWELCLGREGFWRPGKRREIYRSLSAVVIQALKRFGIDAHFRPENDVEVEGRKISGTGGVEWNTALIYQGTLLVDFDVDTMLSVLRLPLEKLGDKAVDSFRRRTVTMAELLGAAPPIAAVKAAVAQACALVLGVELEPGPLTPEEADRWVAMQDRYRDNQWIERRTPPAGSGYAVAQSVFKAPGGLIRAYLQVDETAGRIRKAFLTGDFFALPDRAPLDLEAALKDAPISVEAIARRVEHHYRQGYRYLGVAPEDWIRVIVEAAQSGVGRAVSEQGRK